MMVSAPSGPPLGTRGDFGTITTLADVAAAAFEEALQAAGQRAHHQQAAIAFERSTMFGLAHAPPHGNSEAAASTAPPPLKSIGDINAADAMQHPESGAVRIETTPSARLAPMAPGRPAAGGSKNSSRPPSTLVPTAAARPAGSSSATFSVSPKLPVTRTSAPKTLAAQSLRFQSSHTVLVAVQETEHGLAVWARMRALDKNLFTELRSETQALLARHGYRMAAFDLCATRQE